MTANSLFQILDFDRTLFHTSAFAKAVTDEINKIEPGLGTQLDRRFEEAYSNEQTFFIFRHLREERGDEWVERLVASVVDQYGADSFLLPGAKERLELAESLSDEKPAWGILTYGDAVDQIMKLKIAGLSSAPVLITDTPDKATIIQAWQNDDDTFTLPEVFGRRRVDQLLFEDDKLRAFRNLPRGVRGIWITADKDARHRLSAENINAVTPVISLRASIELIRNSLD